MQLLTRILQIYSINGFTGVPEPGVKKNSMAVDIPADVNQSGFVAGISDGGHGIVDEVPEAEDDDEDETETFDGI
ncbi:hypothetical protein C0993_004593, partial [Termitomyces sp. T159_Od127]